MDLVTKKKWDRAAANFDLMAGYGPSRPVASSSASTSVTR